MCAKRINNDVEEIPAWKKKYAEKTEGGEVIHGTRANPNFLMSFQNKKLSATCGYMKAGVPFIIWESIPECDTDKCAVSSMCPYTAVEGKKCVVQAKYLKNVYAYLLNEIKNDVDEIRMMDIGLNLMTLYGHLIKFKLLEASLGHGVSSMTKKGVVIHPIYKEIRVTLSAISMIQKEVLTPKSKVLPMQSVAELMSGEDSPELWELMMPKIHKNGPKKELGVSLKRRKKVS